MAQRPPVLVAMLASVLPLLTVPLGVFGLAVFSTGLAQAWVEGGPWMHATLVAAGIASLFSCGVVFAAIWWKSWLAAFSSVLAVGVLVVGALGARSGLALATAAVAKVDPIDRARIMHGAMGEASIVWVFALLLAGALLVLVAGTFTVDFMARLRSDDTAARRFSLALTLVIGALGVWSALLAAQETALAQAHRSFASVGPADWLSHIAAALQENEETKALASMLLALSMVLLIGSLAMLRQTPIAVGTLLGLLAFPAGVLGSRALAAPSPQALESLTAKGPALIKLEAPVAEGLGEAVLTDELRTRDGAVVEASAIESMGWPLPVDVAQEATRSSMQSMLRKVFAAPRKEVFLQGSHTIAAPPGFVVPMEFGSILNQTTHVKVMLDTEAKACSDGCQFASLGEGGMKVGDEQWAYEALSGEWADFEKTVMVRLADVEPSLLMKATATAAKHAAQLVVIMPGGSSEPN